MGDYMNNKKPKIKQGLRGVKQTFIKDTELEPSLKMEISKEQIPKKTKNK